MFHPLYRQFEYGHVSYSSSNQLGTHQAATVDATVGIDILTTALLTAAAMLWCALLFHVTPTWPTANGDSFQCFISVHVLSIERGERSSSVWLKPRQVAEIDWMAQLLIPPYPQRHRFRPCFNSTFCMAVFCSDDGENISSDATSSWMSVTSFVFVTKSLVRTLVTLVNESVLATRVVV